MPMFRTAGLVALLWGGSCWSGMVQAAEVNVYTTRQPQLVQPVLDRFTKDTGIKVNVLFAEKGLVERIKQEGRRSPADMILTADIGQLMEGVKAEVTAPLKDEVLEELIPANFRDPSGHWFAITTRGRVIFAAKDRVKDGEITTYEGLTDPRWKGRICTRPGKHAYNVGLVAAMIQHKGTEATKAWLTGLRANLARKPQGNDRGQIQSVHAGECDLALSNTYYLGAMLANPDQRAAAESVKVVFPRFEGGGTHLNISGMSMTKHAPNREAALKLMRYMLSVEAQRLYSDINTEFPVRAGVAPNALMQSWGRFEADGIALADVAAKRGEALKLLDEVAFDE